MIYSLTGKVIHTDASGIAVQCGGVAFYCAASFNTLRRIGSVGADVTLYTYLSVREDAMDLFGFHDPQELQCFKLLIGVTGVGPKAALSILSQMEPERLALCVASGDAKSITKAQGVGNKLAQRVVLELKDKFKTEAPLAFGSDAEAAGAVSASQNCEEAVSALEMLGYGRSEASAAVGKLDSSLPTETLIRQALRNLSKLS
ncbi:MAG: Holliday junction branch migration protein RuvA [Clostridia bacterium]|nr:Holliday junction branch migration protein RuvA [Clostridia bacterium]